MTASILIVGAGVAGRATARALAQHGLRCAVVERRPSPAGLGMGLNLPGNATRVLRELGVAGQVAANGAPVHRREYRNERGRLLFATDDEAFWDGVAEPVAVRHGYLLAALELPGGVLLDGTTAVTAEPSVSGVDVLMERESRPRSFDFVIGADGVHSTMRAAVTAEGPRSSSMTRSCWRFVCEDPGVGCWAAWSGSTATFLLIPVGKGCVYGYAARTRGGDTGREPEWLARTAASFPDLVRRAVAQALTDGELHHATVDEVRIERWHRGRLVLVGDAAHATGPVWAQGAAMALEDATVLAGLLATTPPKDWDRVGANFERLRRPRVEHVQRVTDAMSRLSALPVRLRDLVAPVMGPRNFRRAYQPLRTPPYGGRARPTDRAVSSED